MKRVDELNVRGRRVLVRCDFNVPLTETGEIEDDFRIRQSISTIKYLRAQGAVVIVMSHLGRPEEESPDLLHMDNISSRLQDLLSAPVRKLPDSIGKEVEKAVQDSRPGDVFLLENLRFHKEEEENDPLFATALARLGNYYVNDAFGVVHRKHASVVGVPSLIPAAAGFLLLRELEVLGQLRTDPPRPFVVLVGGNKIATKISFIDEMSMVADTVLVGNLLAQEASQRSLSFPKPEKIIWATDGYPTTDHALDIGPETTARFTKEISRAASLCWAGPMGATEQKAYTKGSRALVEAVRRSKAYSVAGGGDLEGFLGEHGLRDAFDYVSTGGSSMLAFLSGEELPGLQALER